MKVSLLNFTITPKGLEDQMLGVFVVRRVSLTRQLSYRRPRVCVVTVLAFLSKASTQPLGHSPAGHVCLLQVTEMPEMEERKNALTLNNARMKKELQEIENKILYMLSNSKGNILDDENLIETLAQSKVRARSLSLSITNLYSHTGVPAPPSFFLFPRCHSDAPVAGQLSPVALLVVSADASALAPMCLPRFPSCLLASLTCNVDVKC